MVDVYLIVWEERGISESRVYFIVRIVFVYLKEVVKYSVCFFVSCYIGNGLFGLEIWRGRRVLVGCFKSVGFVGLG